MTALPRGHVRFVLTPFLPETQPSLGVGSLCAVLKRNRLSCDTVYLNIDFGVRIGWELYKLIATALPAIALVGESLFHKSLWGEEHAEAFDGYLIKLERWLNSTRSNWSNPTNIGAFVDNLRSLATQCPAIVHEWADRVLEGTPSVVAFSSMFQQNLASLALAKELRRRVPAERLRIVFGGANCDGEMGKAIADNFPFVDCVVSGEGEAVIPDVVRLDAAPPRWVQGPMIECLDELPFPDFEAYFEAIRGMRIEPLLSAESSRGCWWGQKSNCVFCGLNGNEMRFREKSSMRFVAELNAQARHYGIHYFNITDNVIPPDYPEALYQQLANNKEHYFLFYETKANIDKDKLRMMAAAGVGRIQPGIESLSTRLLRFMKKGTTVLHNLALLKWCVELRVGASWNVLYGFPGEPAEEYEKMASLLPLIYHLPPPSGGGPVQLVRFGPMWKEPERFGLYDVQPFWSVPLIYSGLPSQEAERIALFFSHRRRDGVKPETYVAPLLDGILEWYKANRHGATLEILDTSEGWILKDTRGIHPIVERPLDRFELCVLKALDGPRTRESLVASLKADAVGGSWDGSDDRLEDILQRFFLQQCVLEDEGKLLSIVVNRSEYQTIPEKCAPTAPVRASEPGAQPSRASAA